MTKRVVKKPSASKKPQKSLAGQRRDPHALDNPEANDEAIKSPPKQPVKAERVAKVVNLIVSVGDEDRGRDFEKFLAYIKKQLKAVEPPFVDEDGNRKPGMKVALTGGYYILDGKVCLPEDYDPKKQGFKKGAVPPEWAGGPAQKKLVVGVATRQMDWDLENLSSEDYDKKYRIGRYAPPSESDAEHNERMRRQRAEQKRLRDLAEEEALEEVEWDLDDVNDDEKLGKVADESASRAVKRMKSKGKQTKRVVKKPAAKPEPKKVVRRVKK